MGVAESRQIPASQRMMPNDPGRVTGWGFSVAVSAAILAARRGALDRPTDEGLYAGPVPASTADVHRGTTEKM
jgi:hypothetical protein